jgi:hypothetical protein
MKKLLILPLIITFFSANAQTTVIPDANFEQALINLGYDLVIDGQVPTANIDTIRFLDLNSLGISSMTGIEDFTLIETLICVGNPLLTSLDVSQNSALIYLKCENQLTSLDVTQNTQLVELYCGSNQLTSIDITQNTLLERFDCSYNQIHSVDLTNNTSLTHLVVSDNPLNSLNITQNQDLIFLNCRNTQISSLDVTLHPMISSLSCVNNQLNSIDLTQNPLLRYLFVSMNQITNLNVSQNPLLEYLYCDNNQLISLTLAQNSALKRLICDSNQLSCLNVRNGTNNNFINNFPTFSATNNPNLTCIEVDNPSWNITGWGYIDPQTSFTNNCGNLCSVGINENSLSYLSLYPNPTNGNITIDIGEIKTNVKSTITNSIGQVRFVGNYNSTDYINFDFNDQNGIYFLQIEADGKIITKKIIKQ